MALTFASLDEMAPGRMILGIGAYWDPLAWKQGIERTKPVRQMREYIEVVRRLLAMEDVDYDGEVVKVRDIRLELGKGAERRPKHVPIYIGATGLQMVNLTGQVADGILLNAFTSLGYQTKALERLDEGAKRAGRSLEEIDKPQLVAVFLSDDGESARHEARHMATMYLGQQPHIAKASGIEQALIDDVNRAMGGWPPEPDGIDKAMALVPDEVVDELCAAGTAGQCRERVSRYVKDGVHPIVMPLTANYDEVMDAFAPETWSVA
jgi:5,10-methylenetetrahydromethanopterin reductase